MEPKLPIGSHMGISNYFPLGSGDNTKDSKEKLHDKLEACRSLCKIIHDVNNSNSHMDDDNLNIEYQALAFLVEASYQLDPENWKSTLKDLNAQLLSKATESKPDVDGINWTLTQLIDNLYKKALGFNILKAQKDQNENKREGLKRSLKLYEVVENFSKRCHQTHRLYSFGGIRPDFVPEWYKDIKLPEKKEVKEPLSKEKDNGGVPPLKMF